MSRLGKILGIGSTPSPQKETVPSVVESPVVQESVVVETTEPVRARDENGHFIADDPSTPENEAWVGGVSPKKTKKRTHRSK